MDFQTSEAEVKSGGLRHGIERLLTTAVILKKQNFLRLRGVEPKGTGRLSLTSLWFSAETEINRRVRLNNLVLFPECPCKGQDQERGNHLESVVESVA